MQDHYRWKHLYRSELHVYLAVPHPAYDCAPQRVQNRAAAAIAALQWHRFEQQIFQVTPLEGHACIGSLCFDGNAAEASVHWLEPSSDPDREFDVYCCRVATGHAMAVNLAEFTQTRNRFRNFVDLMKEWREDRFQAVLQLPAQKADPVPNRHPIKPWELNQVPAPVATTAPTPGPTMSPARSPAPARSRRKRRRSGARSVGQRKRR